MEYLIVVVIGFIGGFGYHELSEEKEVAPLVVEVPLEPVAIIKKCDAYLDSDNFRVRSLNAADYSDQYLLPDGTLCRAGE